MKANNTLAAQSMSEQEINTHKNLINFGEADASLLKAHASVIESSLDKIVERFYDYQMSIPETKAVIDVDDRLPKLKITMKAYIQQLFAGEYGTEYVTRRLEIGRSHENLGVSAKFYMSAAYQLENLLRETIDINEPNSAPLRAALHKIMHFDMQIIMDTYIESLLTKVKFAQEELEDYAESLEEVVTERTRQLNELSRKDELTELVNRDGMLENLSRELANAGRYKETISFVCFSLNGYQELVRSKGQAIGNVVLNQIGHDIKSQIREADIPCRVADNEFCIIMPRTQTNEAEAISKRLIDMFEQDNQHKLSFSMGIATTGPEKLIDVTEFIKQVESRMQSAGKEAGFAICAE
ncbi:MAG: GGDEF domain-containing protein [Gammaproteobacteria bacterium]|nr:GGDEF domain-containing protein [Gammaproteobacteria bacterium]